MLIVPNCVYFITLPTPLTGFASLSSSVLLTPLNCYSILVHSCWVLGAGWVCGKVQGCTLWTFTYDRLSPWLAKQNTFPGHGLRARGSASDRESRGRTLVTPKCVFFGAKWRELKAPCSCILSHPLSLPLLFIQNSFRHVISVTGKSLPL